MESIYTAERTMKFKSRVAIKISMVAIILSLIFGQFTYWLSQYAFEQSIVNQVVEISNTLKWSVKPENMKRLASDNSDLVSQLNNIIKFGELNGAEIYDSRWNKIAEVHDENIGVHSELHKEEHFNAYSQPAFKTRKIPDGRLTVNVFVPFFDASNNESLGYFEGLYIVPEWRAQKIRMLSYGGVLFVMLAVLICGAVLYPVILSLYGSLEEKSEKLYQSNVLLMKSLGEAIARRDNETGAHNARVTLIAVAIAKAMQIPFNKMGSIISGALLHDIGKIAIPDSILLKPDKLSVEEFEIMKTHVKHGEALILGKGLLTSAYDIISGHHEKWNGSGYPRGLKGAAIPLAARIFAVADVFDALISKRPYKEAFTYSASIDLIKKGSGSHFDPNVVEIFLSISEGLYKDLMAASERNIEIQLDEAINLYFK